MSGDHFEDDNEIFGVAPRKAVKPVETFKEPEVRHVNKNAKFAMSAIVKMLQNAYESGLKYQQFRAEGLIISRAPDGGKNPGAIYVKRDNDSKTYLGKIIEGGEWYPTRDANMGDSEALKRICENPLESLVAFGRQTGRCAICSKTLTNAVSIARGIGPICAVKYGFGSAFTAEEIKADGDNAKTVEPAQELVQTLNTEALNAMTVKAEASLNASVVINGKEMTRLDLITMMIDIIDEKDITASKEVMTFIQRVSAKIVDINKGE